jgi:lactoylglutathione lyase
MRLDHVLICTPEVRVMEEFFFPVLELEKGPRPPFSFPGTWLYSRDRPIIHLAETADRGTGGVVDHIAFSGDNYQTLMARLERAGLGYYEHTVPGSGEYQVFVDGPCGITIEIQFPPGQAG